MTNCKTNPLGFHVYPPDRLRTTLKPCECGQEPTWEMISHFITTTYGVPDKGIGGKPDRNSKPNPHTFLFEND